MALPGSGSLSIKTTAGSGRSIAQEVDGNVTGTKSLTSLSVSAGKTAPHGMLEFYGYSSAIMTTVNLSGGTVTTSTSGLVWRQSTQTVSLTFTNGGLFAGGTFGTQIMHYVEAQSNQVGGVGSALIQRTSPSPASLQVSASFGSGVISSITFANYVVGASDGIAYNLRAFELGNNSSVYAISSIRIQSVWVETGNIIPSIGVVQNMSIMT